MTKKLGQILISKKILTEAQLIAAMTHQMQVNAKSKRKFKIGEILLYLKSIDMNQLHQALREQRPNPEPPQAPASLDASEPIQVIRPAYRRNHPR